MMLAPGAALLEADEEGDTITGAMHAGKRGYI